MLLIILLASGSTVLAQTRSDRVRRYTRQEEFDFAGWTLDALGLKLGQFGLGASTYLTDEQRREVVIDYMTLIDQAGRLNRRVEEIYADPQEQNPGSIVEPIVHELAAVKARLLELGPLAEAVLQENAGAVLHDLGLGPAGPPFPPVAFHFSELPFALVVSPREVIRQDANIQLEGDLTLQQQIQLEGEVEHGLDVSALVVPIGGLSTYPTMVMQSSSLEWVTQTVVHEWVHHYLALRPLGLSYDRTPEMRTINETVASILGREVGREILRRYYPEHLPPPAVEEPPPEPGEPPAFDFRAEMHETRVRTDELLAQGRIEEAEAYMEARRLVFWEHGYRHIRRINQAYFAFHGAYGAEPGGPAGEDPVGEAVRQLWENIRDPARFLRTVAWIDDFSELQALLLTE